MMNNHSFTAQPAIGVHVQDHVLSSSKASRMVDAAHQFEASLMQELFAPLQESGLSDDDGAGSGSTGALTSYASQAMARAVSDRGGFGIASQIIAQLKKGDI
jgi:Rod binding domain-containing protein